MKDKCVWKDNISFEGQKEHPCNNCKPKNYRSCPAYISEKEADEITKKEVRT